MGMVSGNKFNYFINKFFVPARDSIVGKLDTSKVVNSLLTTVAGFALDARQGKVLDDKITALNSKLPSFKQVYFGNAGGGFFTVSDMSKAQFVCIEAVYANKTYGGTMLPFEQFKQGYDCYASYGKDANIWALAKYNGNTSIGINCGTADVRCRVSIL